MWVVFMVFAPSKMYPESATFFDAFPWEWQKLRWKLLGHALAMQRNLARPQRREVPEYPEPEEARCTDRRVGWLGCLMHLMPNDVCSLLMCLVCSSYSLHVVPDLKASAWINPSELLQHVQSVSHDWKNWEATWIMPHAISCNTSCSSMVLYFKIEPTYIIRCKKCPTRQAMGLFEYAASLVVRPSQRSKLGRLGTHRMFGVKPNCTWQS